MVYSQAGTYAVYAGLVVTIAHLFGLNLVQGDVEATIGVLVVLGGAIYQAITHKKLAQQAGAIPR